ncbi:imm11 family protein [Geothrix alkalitolerans]|uniref:imm11 family protein n=1 Tax=Geothrix alkalitolerans TaxID=2922724 RepID=UPI003B8487DC
MRYPCPVSSPEFHAPHDFIAFFSPRHPTHPVRPIAQTQTLPLQPIPRTRRTPNHPTAIVQFKVRAPSLNNLQVFELRQDWAFGQLGSPQAKDFPLYFEPASEDSFYQNWSSIEITLSGQSLEDGKPVPDFSQLPPDVFLFSQCAVDALNDLLLAHGNLYPTVSQLGKFWAYRITTSIPALNLGKSVVRRSASGSINLVSKLTFETSLIGDSHIFQIPELPCRAFVTNEFARRVYEFKLSGIDLHDSNEPYSY